MVNVLPETHIRRLWTQLGESAVQSIPSAESWGAIGLQGEGAFADMGICGASAEAETVHCKSASLNAADLQRCLGLCATLTPDPHVCHVFPRL